MSRPSVYSSDDLLDAARSVLFRGGVESATIQAISAESGAPVGSLYNRFRSRRDLLAQLWLRAAQRLRAASVPALREEEPLAAAVALALAQVTFAKAEPADARLLASFRREDLLCEVESPELARTLEQLNLPVERAMRELCKRLFGDLRSEHQRLLCFAVIDMPLAAVRRYLLSGRAVPASVEAWVERGVRAVLAAPEAVLEPE